MNAPWSAGQEIVLHCRVGYERTGTDSAHLQVERGEGPATAQQRVRTMPEGMLEDEKRIGYIRSRVSCVAAGDLAGPVIEWLYWGALGDGLGYAIAELSWSAI